MEWYLLQSQLQLQWGLPAVIPGYPYEQSHIQHKPCNKAKPHETLKTSWPRKSFSVLTRDLVFIPEPVRRRLEFHLQKQLIHLRWGLSQRIQRSIHLVLSSPGQQPQSCSSGALPNVSILQPGDPEADGSRDTFAVAVDRGSVPTPHLFGQAKAMLKTHIDSKCGQIHQGKVPACVQSSWEWSLAVGASFSNIPASRHLELQAKNNPDLHHKAVSQEPVSADQEKQALSGALIEHCKRPQALSEETIKKLETSLQHQYVAFLSGLPAPYCVALSRPSSPGVTSKPKTTERMSRAVKSPLETLPHATSLEGPLEPMAVGDLEEGDAGLGLSPTMTSGKTHHDGDEEPEKRSPPETPQGSSEQRPSSHLEDPCPHSPEDLSEFEFSDPPPEVLMETNARHHMQGSLTKVDAIPEPAKIAKVAQPVASKTSQGLPFPHPPTQGKAFRDQAWQDHISQRRVMPASPHASPSLPGAGLKNKMKSFLHSLSCKIKGKTHKEPTVSTPRKVPKPSQENVDKGLPQAKSPTKKTKTKNCRGPKAQAASSERSVNASFLTAPQILDSKLGPRSQRHGSVSVPGQHRHCPRHYPRLAHATQQGNPP